MTTTVLATAPARKSWGKRLIQFPLTRIILATFLVALSAAITFSLCSAIAAKSARLMWPEILSAGAVLFTYWAYNRYIEKRTATDLSGTRALPEVGAGLLIGALMVAGEIGVLYVLGYYELAGVNTWSMKTTLPIAEMIFVAVLEEVISRGIIFRITEKSLGSRVALVISALLFGLAHIPGEGAGILAIGNTVVAGVFFAAAYMLTRRLWLCIAIHAAWNYTLGSIFSIAVSGRESKGLLIGKLNGPDWITGGAYGLEASVVTLIALMAVGGYFLWMARARGHFIASSWRRDRLLVS